MRQSLDSSLRDFFLRGGIPVTKALMVCAVVTMMIAAFGGSDLLARLVFSWPEVVQKPWSAITYPLVSPPSPLGVLFAVIWLWFMGSSLERSWGSRAFALFFAWVSLLTAIGASAAAFLAGKSVFLMGLWIPLAPLTVAWAAINPEAQVLFYFIIPLKAKYLAWITAAFLYLYTGVSIHPLYGALVLLGCAVAYYQVSQRGVYRSPLPDIRLHRWNWRRFDPAERFREWRRRKRLEKLFRNSGFDDRDLR